jgi:hypothetical protein
MARLAVLLSTTLPLAACAGVWSDECRGLSAREKQDAVRVAACQGEMEAEYRLGLRYEKGDGKTAPDLERARFWYALAARPRENKTLVYAPAPGKGKGTLLSVPRPETPGHAGAQYRLGLLYARGWGVKRDDATAREWFEKAAAQGHALGRMFLRIMKNLDMDESAPAKSSQADDLTIDISRICPIFSLDTLDDPFRPWTIGDVQDNQDCLDRIYYRHLSLRSMKAVSKTKQKGSKLFPGQAYVRWSRDVTIWLVSKNPEDRKILEEAVARLPDLPIRISISDRQGDFRIVAFGPRYLIADKRYCYIDEGCDFIHFAFSEGVPDKTGKRIWAYAGIHVFKPHEFLPLFEERLRTENKTGRSYKQENWVVFTPKFVLGAAAVEGYIARSKNGNIDQAECIYQPELRTTEIKTSDNRLRKRTIRECLLRGLGVVNSSQCAISLSPVSVIPGPPYKGRNLALTAAFLDKVRENNDYSDCDMALLEQLYELPATQSSGEVR